MNACPPKQITKYWVYLFPTLSAKDKVPHSQFIPELRRLITQIQQVLLAVLTCISWSGISFLVDVAAEQVVADGSSKTEARESHDQRVAESIAWSIGLVVEVGRGGTGHGAHADLDGHADGALGDGGVVVGGQGEEAGNDCRESLVWR
jgi:hypothetical protein